MNEQMNDRQKRNDELRKNKVYFIRHKGTGHLVEAVSCLPENIDKAVAQVAEENDYAAYDLSASEGE